jgi:probable HAF family extracellular repeat protein
MIRVAGVYTMMNCYEIQESGFTGQVWPSSTYAQQFYFYSVSRSPQREQLFDGVAGDIAEAVSTMQAHIRFLASDGGSAAKEWPRSSMKTTVDEQGKFTNATAAAQGQAPLTVVDLGPFDNNRNDILAINDCGQAAGVSMNAGTGRIEAFIEETGKRRSLGTLGGSFSIARGINNRGEIVGGSLTSGDDSFHGFVYRDNRLFDLNALLDPGTGWELIQAFAINNRGEILGVGAREGQDRIVLLRPKS